MAFGVLVNWPCKMLLIFVVFANALAAEADTATRFDIRLSASMDIDDALRQLSDQTGTPILMFQEDVAGKSSIDLVGTYSLNDALIQLTRKTGLSFQQLPNGSIVVFKPQVAIDSGEDEQQQFSSERPIDVDAPRILSPVFVRGFIGAIDRATDIERSSVQIISASSAEDIGQFPEQNISEALQRLPGIQLSRVNGEGTEISIRGLPPEFTRVEIDGRNTTVNADRSDPQRSSVLSVFASDLFDTVRVVKTPNAADTEGAISGTIRLNTPDPLDLEEDVRSLKFRARASKHRDLEPYVSGVVSSAVMDDRLGFLLAGSYEVRDRELSRAQNNLGWMPVTDFASNLSDLPSPDTVFLPRRIRQEVRGGDTERLNLNGKVQLELSDEINLHVGANWVQDERSEARSRIQFRVDAADVLSAGDVSRDGTVRSAEFGNVQTDSLQFVRLTDVQSLGLSTGLRWENDIALLEGRLSIVESTETLDEVTTSFRDTGGMLSYSSVQDSTLPNLSSPLLAQPLSTLAVRRLQDETRIIDVNENSFQLDGAWQLNAAHSSSLKTGLRVSRSNFSRRQGFLQYQLDGLTYADGRPFLVNTPFAEGYGSDTLLRTWPAIDPVNLREGLETDGSFSFNDADVYMIDENISAAYIMLDTNLKTNTGWNVQFNGGMRLVYTDSSGSGRTRIISSDGGEVVFIDDGPERSANYFDMLPSFNLKLDPAGSSKWEFRGALSRSLSRPDIESIAPTTTINLDSLVVTRGAPDLDPYHAWQIDAGVRYFFGQEDKGYFAADIFYKNLDDYIFPVTRSGRSFAFPELAIPEFTGTLRSFEAGGDAYVQGFELALHKPFTNWPGLLSNAGLLANYTYSDSKLENLSGVEFKLPGTSKHTLNAVGYYETDRFSARIAYNFRDEFIAEIGDEDGTNTVFNDAQGRLDFSLRYRPADHVNFTFDMQNLTGESNFLYYDTPTRLEDFTLEAPLYSAGVSYRF